MCRSRSDRGDFCFHGVHRLPAAGAACVRPRRATRDHLRQPCDACVPRVQIEERWVDGRPCKALPACYTDGVPFLHPVPLHSSRSVCNAIKMARCETAAALILLLCCLSVWLPMPRTVEWNTWRAAFVQFSVSPLLGAEEGESLQLLSRWPPPAPAPDAPTGRTQPTQRKGRKGRKGKEGGCDVRCESATLTRARA